MIDKPAISREMSRKLPGSNSNSGASAESSTKQDNPVASFEKTKDPLTIKQGESIVDDKRVSSTQQSQPTVQSCPSD